ncbi:hypothetical protein XELAEV_18012330mg [Xenopus laevis]|uniref:Uncharacterized protein n=1 Tax=Xenopus laevis TaxID=8355 RepID=A0A974DMH3_XENLA|nr:hypothetical protein XELAEV_18012330mg [Xenopus laevis]
MCLRTKASLFYTMKLKISLYKLHLLQYNTVYRLRGTHMLPLWQIVKTGLQCTSQCSALYQAPFFLSNIYIHT